MLCSAKLYVCTVYATVVLCKIVNGALMDLLVDSK